MKRSRRQEIFARASPRTPGATLALLAMAAAMEEADRLPPGQTGI
jgi:hypothetical protein